MIELGLSTPCLSLGIRVVGHVDDLMCVCPRSGLNTFLAKLKSVYEVTSTFLGPDHGNQLEGEFRVRGICWRIDGLTWTGDAKLVEEARDQLTMCGSNEV